MALKCDTRIREMIRVIGLPLTKALLDDVEELERDLAEAREAAEWTLITPENLPKKGQVIIPLDYAETLHCKVQTEDWDSMYYEGWFINPPAPATGAEQTPSPEVQP